MIDWDMVNDLREALGEADFAEVTELFLRDSDAAIAALAPGPGLAERLHYLKGSALTMGLTEFSVLCGRAEAAAGLGRTPELGRVRDSYTASRDALLARLPRPVRPP